MSHLLEKIDLSRFALKEYRNFDDCEYRTPGMTGRPTGKTLEVLYTQCFPQDYLVTVGSILCSTCKSSSTRKRPSTNCFRSETSSRAK